LPIARHVSQHERRRPLPNRTKKLESASKGRDPLYGQSLNPPKPLKPRIQQRTVIFNPTNPDFRRLVEELGHRPGVYRYQHGALVLKVGQSGKRAGQESGLGRRLAHHVTVAYFDHASHRKGFPAWHAFMTALLDRQITVRWIECPPEELDRIEQSEIASAPGGVLWERLKHENASLKRHPDRLAKFTSTVAAIIDSTSTSANRTGFATTARSVGDPVGTAGAG
jgi:hypothetical protein